MDESFLPNCGLSSCTTVCPNNVTEFEAELDCGRESGQVVKLRFLTASVGSWIERSAKAFNEIYNDVEVEIIVVGDLSDLLFNSINEATSKTGIYDGFITSPATMGSVVEEGGWADLRPYIGQDSKRAEEWSDLLVAYRNWISQYQGQILAYPLDGDVLHLFYRKDALDAFGFRVPRTWEEYNIVAKALHGRVFKNQTLSGSCVARMPRCAGAHWANLVLSSMTQTNGPSSGHLFSTSTMQPLLGDALLKTMEFMETQVKYGSEDEWTGCIGVVNDRINKGSCAMSYNWGNTFAAHLREGSVFRQPGYELGVAPTPGSTQVLDRETMKLVQCDSKRCPHAEYFKDIGFVNRAPYLAFGGWSCAVNNYTTPGKKDLAAEFCNFASSKGQSMKMVVGDAFDFQIGSDPFRKSHLNKDVWVQNGYERDSVEKYLETIQGALTHDNVVTDTRFPLSGDIYDMIDLEFHDHLYAAYSNEIPFNELPARRELVRDRLERQWKKLIADYNGGSSSRSTILMQYQKLRNAYFVEVEKNQLGTGIIAYGYAMATLVLVAAMTCGFWTYKYRKMSVIRASQPFFLILISIGVFVFGSSIIPLTVDDSRYSAEVCSKACMTVPWLTCMGWSILFAAMYAKIRRVNLVIHNVRNFKSVKVSEKDVMPPFAMLFTANFVLLLLWTLLDPLYWKRRETSATESYGACSADGDSLGWKIILPILSALNGAALIGANVEAWKARKVDTAYGESSYIGLIMVSLLQVLLLGVPLSFLVNNNPTARFFVNSSIAFVISMSVLSLLFLPKFLSSFEKQQGGRIVSRSQVESSQLYPESSIKTDELRDRLNCLQNLLQDAGIDGKSYLVEAGLEDLIAAANERRHRLFANSSSLPDSLAYGQEESVVGGYSLHRDHILPPVTEEENVEEDMSMAAMEEADSTRFPTYPVSYSEGTHPEVDQIAERSQAITLTRGSVSAWLAKKRNLNASSSGGHTSDGHESLDQTNSTRDSSLKSMMLASMRQE